MATCVVCELDQWTVDGCAAVAYLHAYRYGSESWFVNGELEPLERCVDCGARVGFHHHANCLYASCVECGGQAACCERHNVEDEP